MLKVLHCVLDDKFIDSMIEVMDLFHNQSEHIFVCLSQVEASYNYIKQKSRVKRVKNEDFLNFINSGGYDVVFIHSIFALHPKLITEIPRRIKVVWLAWGYDIYESIFYNRSLIHVSQLYRPFTLFIKDIGYFANLKAVFFDIISRIRFFSLREAWGRIDYFSGVIPSEYDMIVNNPRNSFFRAERIEWNYFSLNSECDENHINSPYVDGDNIQIGNSGDPTNNHLDMMRILRIFRLKGRKVYVPMSYGGSKTYLAVVRKYGQYLWKKNFIPLTDFLPKEQYYKILGSSRYALFYHERQQAMGNIYTALWNGCMVFVSETSPVYKHLQNLGFLFFTIQHDLHKIENGEKLSYEEMRHNRMVYIKNLSTMACLERISKTLDILAKACGK